MTIAKKYGYLWITAVLFLGSLVGHWTFAWYAYVDDQKQHGSPIEVSGYVVETMRDTLENWQSEFLQLMWQVGGLAFLLYVGSPQSKEGDERIEAKLDLLIKEQVKDGDEKITQIVRRFPKK
jgi:hypothetical protein